MRHILTLTAILVAITLQVGCGRKPEPAPASPLGEVVCTYAPSQSKTVLAISATAGGAGAGASAVASAAGLTAVLHSSGAYIFTGAAGYVAGTIGAAALVPIVVTVGAVAGGAAATVELACASKNHADLVAKIELMAKEFAGRFK
jgi:hypothetical protein